MYPAMCVCVCGLFPPPLQGISLVHMGMRLKAIEHHRGMVAGLLSQAQPLGDVSEDMASTYSPKSPPASRWSAKEQEILQSFAVNASDTQSGGVDLEELEALTRSVDTLLRKEEDGGGGGGGAREHEEAGSGGASVKAQRQSEKRVSEWVGW